MESVTLELRSETAPTIKRTFVDAGTFVLGSDARFVHESDGDEQARLLVLVTVQQLLLAPGYHTTLLVNGKAAVGPTAVQNGDWVTIGKIVYQVGLSPRSEALTVSATRLAASAAAAPAKASTTISSNCACSRRVPSARRLRRPSSDARASRW